MLHRLCRSLQPREKSTGSFSLLSVIAYFLSACRLTSAWWFFTLTSSMPYKGFSLEQQSEILHSEWCALVKAITATIWTFPAPTPGYTQTWTFSWLIWSERQLLLEGENLLPLHALLATQTYLSWVSALVWSCQEPVQHSRPETLTKSDEFSLSLAPWESALPWSNEWHRRRSAPWQWGVGSCQRGCNNWTSFVKNMVSKFHKLLMIELHTLQWCMSQE